MTKIRALSGFAGKGPACFLAEIGDARLLVDLGEGPDAGRKPDLTGIGAVDAVIVSHGHGDHVGALDLLPQIGSPPLYATQTVGALRPHPALAAARDLPLRGSIEIAGQRILTGRTGHAPGGAWMRIGGEDGVFYASDVSLESELYPFDMPPRAALAVIDAAYGVYDGSLADGMAQLRAIAEKSSVLLPVPVDGRGLEIAMRLGAAGLPIRACETHHRVATILLAQPADVLTDRGRVGLRALLATQPLDADSEPGGVMLTANPQGRKGMAAALLAKFHDRSDVEIVFTGHLAPGAPSSTLVNAGRARFIRCNVHPPLRDNAAILKAVQPQQAMAAFVDEKGARALAEALPGYKFSVLPELVL